MPEPAIAPTPDVAEEGAPLALLRLAAQERALGSATLQLFAQGNEDLLLGMVPDLVVSLLRCDVVALFLASGEPPVPRCRVLHNGDAGRVLPAADAQCDAFASQVFECQKPRQHGSWSPPGSDWRGTAVGVPVSSHDRLHGVLVAGRTRAEPFREDHISLLSAVGQRLALALLRPQMAEAERLNSEFVSIASHEIRTPLSALQGFSELLLSRDVPSDVQHDWLTLINQEAARLGLLLEEMLDLTRIETGKMTLRPAPIDIGDIVCRVVRLLDDAGRVHVLIEPSPLLVADGGKIEQVVTNLIRNALEYSPREEAVEAEVAPRCLAADAGSLVVVPSGNGAGHRCRPAVSVAFRDRGIGMTAEEMMAVFRPFYRSDASRELAPEGTGLGLAIAKAIIERHGGSLWVRSRPGKGSIFGFCLPAERTSADGTA